jgi:hypothetical protein
LIRRILDPDSVGRPQFIAAAFLLVYLLQCAWLIRVQTIHGSLPDADHDLCIYHGLQQWKGGAVAGTPEALSSEAATGVPSAASTGHLRVRAGFDQDRSPLYYLISSGPFLLKPAALPTESPFGQLWSAAPYLYFGVMLGGSLWYVARRLYGNFGGYIALTLYCFSPGMIVSAAGAQSLDEIGAVWGGFGAVFTAIAVAHTLYAPREVVLWNWRRILLLGLSLTLAVGNQFSLVVLALTALGLMFWVAPVRPRAVVVIWSSAVAVALFLLMASYSFHPTLFLHGMEQARWFDFQPAGFAMGTSYRTILAGIALSSPALLLALPVALIAYFAWKRARYFGNTAPLGIAALMLVFAAAAPGFPGQGFSLVMTVFLFVFVAGVFADLLETGQKLMVAAGVFGLLSASAFWNVVQLARLR